jgi:hypothetical protein
MPRVISIDPGKSKCGIVLAEINEKKVYEAIILKSELIDNYVRDLITANDISQLLLVMVLLVKRLEKNYIFLKKKY